MTCNKVLVVSGENLNEKGADGLRTSHEWRVKLLPEQKAPFYHDNLLSAKSFSSVLPEPPTNLQSPWKVIEFDKTELLIFCLVLFVGPLGLHHAEWQKSTGDFGILFSIQYLFQGLPAKQNLYSLCRQGWSNCSWLFKVGVTDPVCTNNVT